MSRRYGAQRPGEQPTPDHPADPSADPESVARAICLRLLTGQPRTRAELAAALAKRGVPVEAAEAVLDRFDDVGLIDDGAFARAWVETRHRGKGLARRALARELASRGVDAETAQAALQQVDHGAEEAAARALVERKLASTRGVPTVNRIRRLVGVLARKGYPHGMALAVVREALEHEGLVTEGELGVIEASTQE